MAGIEQIVVHSKSYLVRWINVPAHNSISWSLQPHKKSINFGIFKHPGTKNGTALPTESTSEHALPTPSTPSLDAGPKSDQNPHRPTVTAGGNVVDKLQATGFKSVAWTGKCEADRVSMGRYDVLDGEGGTYGLVFDNTYSKQTSKNVTFVLMTHPTSAPPKSGHHLHYSNAFGSNGAGNSVGKSYSPSLRPVTDSSESLPQTAVLHRAVLEDPRPNSKGGRAVESKGIEGTAFYTGILYKRRRKKGQGFAKRFFSLDFTSSTLSYYRDRHSSALRGAVPLSLAAIGVDEKTREFSIDSGAEVWHLKAINKKDFEVWRDALERASQTTISPSPAGMTDNSPYAARSAFSNAAEAREWERVEQLVSKVSGTRDAIRGLARDTDARDGDSASLGMTDASNRSSHPDTPAQDSVNPYFPDTSEDRSQSHRPFWRRKSSAEKATTQLVRKTVGTQLAVPSPSLVPAPISPQPNHVDNPKRPHDAIQHQAQGADVHVRCLALLRDLDNVVADFTVLIAESKSRRLALQPVLAPAASRLSLDSVNDQEFFDAEGGDQDLSQLLNIRRSGEYHEAEHGAFDQRSEADTDASSDVGDGVARGVVFAPTREPKKSQLFPAKPQTLQPLPLPETHRRSTVPAPKQAPPSFIGFLRKNAGKDLSTVSMPVTANEPTSLLQRLAESLEYSDLLDAAAGSGLSSEERLMYVTAFAISYFANQRAKERALRKPFNPMLGETFELVREDRGFRFVAEKVSHHPVRLACQAESLNNGGWTFLQSPRPVQKFWGKSVELNTEGRVRITLHASDQRYSWTQATCFLRNVIAGEKYVEPVQTMTVTNEGGGLRAVATFKTGGMFSGRSEEVNVQFFDATSPDTPLSLGLSGKWTESLHRTDTGERVWSAGTLVPDAGRVYGFTSFAATLNETTAIEEGHLPVTDSRMRPDQLALENSDADKAEALKAKLEERQRARRKVLEGHGQTWQPRFFERITHDDPSADADEEMWVAKMKGGVGEYWARRAEDDWGGIEEVFET